MKKTIYILFVIVALIQLAVPAKMILDREMVLKHGKSFKFKTSPIDPTDIFRGKYIWLDFTDNTIAYKDSLESYSMHVFVIIEENEEGFANIKEISMDSPEGDEYYFRARAYKMYEDEGSKQQLRIDFPFDRFYMEESKAEPAEEVFNKTSNDSAQIAYALVYIKDGRAVLKDVLINGISISLLAQEEIK